MKTQDVIINKEKLVKTLYDIESARCLQEDKNCQLLLSFLLDGPKTFEDIKDAFKEVQSEKSDKTIYGYLNKLKKADLVMETGKRIITLSENQIKTLTLYSRTAKVFYIAIDLEKDMREKYFQATGELLCKTLGYNSYDKECLRKIYDEYIEIKRNELKILNESSDTEFFEKLVFKDTRGTRFVLDTLLFFTYIGKKKGVYDDLVKCFRK